MHILISLVALNAVFVLPLTCTNLQGLPITRRIKSWYLSNQGPSQCCQEPFLRSPTVSERGQVSSLPSSYPMGTLVFSQCCPMDTKEEAMQLWNARLLPLCFSWPHITYCLSWAVIFIPLWACMPHFCILVVDNSEGGNLWISVLLSYQYTCKQETPSFEITKWSWD